MQNYFDIGVWLPARPSLRILEIWLLVLSTGLFTNWFFSSNLL